MAYRIEFHGIESFKVEQVYAHARIIKYLLSQADNRGLTHGEKHYLLQTALMECDWLLRELHPDVVSLFEQHGNANPSDIPDIPL